NRLFTTLWLSHRISQANAVIFPDSKAIFQRLGYATLILASFLLLLYVMNLRSRFYYNGPDYSFLFWLFAWAATAGIGLLLLRKWAVDLLFFQGIAFAVILCVGVLNSLAIATCAIVINYLVVVIAVAVTIVVFP